MNDDGMGRRDAARRVLAAFGAAVFAPLALTGCGEEDEADAVRPQQDEEATPPAAPASPVATGSGPQAGWVSVWVGEFTEELDLDGYLGEPFDRDHGLEPRTKESMSSDPRPSLSPNCSMDASCPTAGRPRSWKRRDDAA